MKDELHRHLDGDVPVEALKPQERDEADEWDRMVASFRTAAPQGGTPRWLEQRVMSEIEALPEAGWLTRHLGWILQPTPVRISPLAAGLVFAAFALVIMIPGQTDTPTPPVAPGPVGATQAIVYVQFLLDAPGATSVSVAGDFSEWEPEFALEDTDGDGVWTGRVPVRPGVHGYMFLIDGTQWQTDPRADRYQDDGFGNRNAIVAVAAGA